MLNVSVGPYWYPGVVTVFKWLYDDAPYPPDSPWTTNGRFGDGSGKMIYFAESALGAMAEFFRRHPEFLGFQRELKVVVFELEIDIRLQSLDVRTDLGQITVGISLERLTSSDADEAVRYLECQTLATLVALEQMSGIAYPSAALKRANAWNLVLFGDPNPMTWKSNSHTKIKRPSIISADVRLFST